MERDDIRMALDAYHRELAKLTEPSSPAPSHFPAVLFHQAAMNSTGPAGAQDLSLPKRFSPESKETDEKLSTDLSQKEVYVKVRFSSLLSVRYYILGKST